MKCVAPARTFGGVNRSDTGKSSASVNSYRPPYLRIRKYITFKWTSRDVFCELLDHSSSTATKVLGQNVYICIDVNMLVRLAPFGHRTHALVDELPDETSRGTALSVSLIAMYFSMRKCKQRVSGTQEKYIFSVSDQHAETGMGKTQT
jgi:hypothetical protein